MPGISRIDEVMGVVTEEMLARASYYKHVSLSRQDLDRSLGRHVRPYTETPQPIRSKDPAISRGG